MQEKKNKTEVECYLTGCKYNTACCLSPYDFANTKCYCTKKHISFDIDEEGDFSFTCLDFTAGHKKVKCIECSMKENDGEIPFDDVFELDEEDDDEFLSD